MNRILMVLAVVVSGTACPRGGANPSDAGIAANRTTPTGGGPAGPGVSPAADAGAAGAFDARVAAGRVALKQTPSDKAKSLALLNFGEPLKVLDQKDGFTHVKASDDTDGWIASDAVISPAVAMATLLVEQDLYARPAALSPVKKRVKRGALVIVAADKNGWKHVRLADKTEGWLPRDRAVSDESELTHALAQWRADMALAEKLNDVALAALQDAMNHHPTARLAPITLQRLTPLLPPDAGPPAADAGAAAPPTASPTDGGNAAPAAAMAVDSGVGTPVAPAGSVGPPDASPGGIL